MEILLIISLPILAGAISLIDFCYELNFDTDPKSRDRERGREREKSNSLQIGNTELYRWL